MISFTWLFRLFVKNKKQALYAQHMHAAEHQSALLQQIIFRMQVTKFGRDHSSHHITNYETFKVYIPVREYEALSPYIEESRTDAPDILIRGIVPLYARSSGTTNAASKYIPTTNEYIKRNHHAGSRDLLSVYLGDTPQSRILDGYTIPITGSYMVEGQHMVGDISALYSLLHIPWWVQTRYAISKNTALIAAWDTKADAYVREAIQKDVRILAGVPTWIVKILEQVISKKGMVGVVWPHMELYIHGGVSLDPYRTLLKKYLPAQTAYREVYNASEGYFAFQDDASIPGEMLLCVNHGVFYEFEELQSTKTDSVLNIYTLENAPLHTPLALVISNISGLYRYRMGDVVMLTSEKPYRIKILGRTKHCLNVCGEELMVGNTDIALAIASERFGATVREYTVAPSEIVPQVPMYHEWLCEFISDPIDFKAFCATLDQALCELNSDYAAKRTGGALSPLVVQNVLKGTFAAWYEKKDKKTAQSKVPRLYKNRMYLEEIRQCIK